MPKGQAELNPHRIIFQWRQTKGSEDSYCYHVASYGGGYQIVDGPKARPIAQIVKVETAPGQFKFWGKVWEWNAISASFIVHNYEQATARNLRSWLNQVIRQTIKVDCEIIGGQKGRPRGVGANEARNKRDRARRKARLQAERFAHMEELVKRSREPMAFRGLNPHQVIDKILDEGLDET